MGAQLEFSDMEAEQAQVQGSAGRISAADKAKNNLGAQPAVLTAQITITRKATGAVEHYTITGTPVKQKED